MVFTQQISKMNISLTDIAKYRSIQPSITIMLNVMLFGKTAREWKSENPNKKGNMRDYASIHQLLVLVNMESYNAILIGQGISQPERMEKLHDLAARQLNVLDSVNLEDLPQLPDIKKE